MRTSAALLVCSLTLAGCGAATSQADPAEHGGGPSHNGNAQSTRSDGPNGQRGAGPASADQGSAALRAGFMEGCRAECARGGALSDCPSYCGCMYARMDADGFERRALQLQAQPESVTLDPFFQRALAACGPEALILGFVNGCAAQDPALRPVCVCVLGRLCEGRTDEGCALWILENPNFGTTPDEAARLGQAATLCANSQR
jgi:hypothetical protein